jgi:putative ABC transport system permease protein
MRRIRAWLVRLTSSFHRERREAELAAELESHIAMHIEENVRAGMTPEQARRDALLKLGGIEQTKELYRDRRRLPWLEQALLDLRFAWRTILRKPGFAAIAILTAALGVGATTAVFSVVDRVLFRSLPYPHDERLVSFGVKAPFEGIEFMLAPEYAVLKRQAGPFESMTSLTPGGADCDITEENPVHATCALVEANFLSTFGIHPIVGRDFVPDDDRPNAPRVALLSYALWRARFAGDPRVAGKNISLDGKPVEIVGVLPATFEMPNLAAVDILLPQALDDSALDRNNPRVILRTFARLRLDVTIEQAAAGLQPWFQDSMRFVPPQFRAEVTLRVRSLRDRQIENSRLGAWVLLGAVIAVLLLACTNVANLLLVRGVARSRELAVRAALGAGRMRLARQALTESMLLALLGGMLGCALAYILLKVFVSIAPEGIVRLQQASLDVRVLVFGLVVSLASGILFGVAPALSTSAPESLAGKTVGGMGRGWLRHTLVVAQIAGSLVLVAGAGLLLRSLWKIESVPLGFEPSHLVVAQLSLAEHRYPEMSQKLAFFEQVEARLTRIPGAELVALSDTLPPSGSMRATFFASIEVPGRPRSSHGTGGMVGWRMVTPNYFPALGIRIVRGRGFTEGDRAPSEHPIILSESLGARLFPNEGPLGKLMRFTAFDRQAPWRTIVGVAANVKNSGLTAEGDPEFYIPWKDDPETYIGRGCVTLRTPLNPATLVQWARTEIAAVDPNVPVQFATMTARVGKLADRPRFDAALLALFAGIGLLLAALGIYGVVSFFVSQRTQEIGVRMALGATRENIFRMVLRSMARWVSAGAALGLLGAWLCARFLQSLLFEIRAQDPMLLSIALLILLFVAFLAAWIPARRATRVDPIVALRYE